MNMREKLARSIMADMGRQNPSLDPVDDGSLLGMADDYDNKFYDAYELADAVLYALMEPSEEMMTAPPLGDPRQYGGHGFNGPTRRDLFMASIQAAKDGK